MTTDEAKRILEHPKFGDPECLAAAQRLRDAEEETLLRGKITKYSSHAGVSICRNCGLSQNVEKCWSCGHHTEVITQRLLESWDLEILQAVCKELEIQ